MKVLKLFSKNKFINSSIINHQINNLESDSRRISKNDVFYCLKGNNTRGDKFITEAINNGAKSIVLDYKIDEILAYKYNVNFIYVQDVQKQLENDLIKLYHNYFKKIKIIGVTGTNGKTTITTLLYNFFMDNHVKVSMIGTSGNYINGEFYKTENTTDDICYLYKLIKESIKQNCQYIFIEISSHAIKLRRIYGLEFEIGLFTNLTLDHLDFHKTMDDYMYTKLMFLKNCKKTILNKDDETFNLYSNYLDNYKTYGFNSNDYKIKNYTISKTNTLFNLIYKNDFIGIKTNLLGVFNIYNITAMISIINELNCFFNLKKKLFDYFKKDIVIDGRMECINYNKRTIYIDFAHTPDGVMNVLKFVNFVKSNRILIVIGCGGSRDIEKRQRIGEISSIYADYCFFTSDNPRNENPEDIINQIANGAINNNYFKITNRKEAIRKALKESEANDIICILGKGNEEYIIENNIKTPYNDKDFVNSLIESK